MKDVDAITPVVAGSKQLMHELLVHFYGYPVDSDAYTDLACGKINRLNRRKRGDVPLDPIFLFSG